MSEPDYLATVMEDVAADAPSAGGQEEQDVETVEVADDEEQDQKEADGDEAAPEEGDDDKADDADESALMEQLRSDDESIRSKALDATEKRMKALSDEAKQEREAREVSNMLFTPDGAREGVPMLLDAISKQTGIPVAELVGTAPAAKADPEKPAKPLSEMTEEEYEAELERRMDAKIEARLAPFEAQQKRTTETQEISAQAARVTPNVLKEVQAKFPQFEVTKAMVEKTLIARPEVRTKGIADIAKAVRAEFADELAKAVAKPKAEPKKARPVIPNAARSGVAATKPGDLNNMNIREL